MTLIADGNRTPPTDLIDSAQTITDTWADLGSEINIDRMTAVGVMLQLDVNNSVDIRVRLLVLSEPGGTVEYPMQIKTVSSTAVNISPEYIEYDPAGDANVLFEFDSPGYYPTGQFQVMAGTVGATAGIVTTAKWAASR